MKKKPLAKNEIKKQSKTVENIILRTLKAYIYFHRFLASALGVWEWQNNHLELGRDERTGTHPLRDTKSGIHSVIPTLGSEGEQIPAVLLA